MLSLEDIDVLRKEWIDHFVSLDGLCCHDIQRKVKINYLVDEIEISDLELFLRQLKSDNVKELNFNSPKLYYIRKSNRVNNEGGRGLIVYNDDRFSRLVLTLDPEYKDMVTIINICKEPLSNKIDKERYKTNREFYLKAAGLTRH